MFHGYYLKLHEHHNKQIAEVKEAAHRIKRMTDVLFVSPLLAALLAVITVLFYIDKVVLKIYSATERNALTDALTFLYNRRHLESYLAEEIDRSGRYKRLFSVAMIDIDNFKKYNDTYGHSGGDKLLQDVAQIITRSVRRADKVFRYGGEEFLIVLPETSRQSAVAPAERVRASIESNMFILPNQQHAVPVTVSVGIATFPEDGNSTGEIIKASDDMLYKAKLEGKNRIKVRELP